MYIRILGNSASGKTTLAKSIAKQFNYKVFHLDAIAFNENSNFVKKSENDILNDYIQICQNNHIVIDGNYLEITKRYNRIPDIIILIDIPVEESLENFNNRFQQFLGKSRPELPGLVENNQEIMIEWIKSYPLRLENYRNMINIYQMQNINLEVITLSDMAEVVALCNNPDILENII